MNKKGFTLVELLATIIILGILVTVVYPTVISTIKSSEKKAHYSEVKTIEKALKLYYLDHVDDLKDLNDSRTIDGCSSNRSVNALKDGKTPVGIKTLIEEGYISDNEARDGNIIDPCTDKPITGDVTVKWICDKKQYEYKFETENTCDWN